MPAAVQSAPELVLQGLMQGKSPRPPERGKAAFTTEASPAAQKRHLSLLSGAAHVRRKARTSWKWIPLVWRAFMAWAALCASSRTRFAPPEITHVPTAAIGGHLFSGKFKRRWLRYAQRINDVWLINLATYGFDAYGWRRDARPPPRQHFWQLPVGPSDAAVLAQVDAELDELVAMNAGYWLDPPCADWEAHRYDIRWQQRYMERVRARDPSETRWRFYNAILAIPKADSDRFRICLSFLALNALPQWIRESYLHRGFSDLEAMFELNSWIADLDLKKFFHQIPASWRTSQAQCVIVRCRRFMFTTAAMGPTLVPFVAQRISNYLSKLVAERCALITTRSLIDDHYWAARTFSACLAASRIVVEVYEYYGAVISIEKAHLYPSQVRAVLKNVIDTTSLRIYSPALRLKRLRHLAASLLATIEAGDTVKPREVATIVGIVNRAAAARGCPPSRSQGSATSRRIWWPPPPKAGLRGMWSTSTTTATPSSTFVGFSARTNGTATRCSPGYRSTTSRATRLHLLGVRTSSTDRQ